MRREDVAEFGQLLDRTCRLLSRGSYVPDTEDAAMFFRALSRFTLAEVRAGFDAHISDPQRGRFVPVPADIIAQITQAVADDGRPGAEEAWALMLDGRDEAKTIVWTQEMAEAWRLARPVLDGGDEVGARMAFREAYGRLVDGARAARVAPKWDVSLGFDKALQVRALEQAQAAGLLPAPVVAALLPAPEKTGGLQSLLEAAPAQYRGRLDAAYQQLVAKAHAPSIDVLEKQHTDALKSETQRMVDAYEGHLS